MDYQELKLLFKIKGIIIKKRKSINCFIILILMPIFNPLILSTGSIHSNDVINTRISDILSQGRGIIITTDQHEWLGAKMAGANPIDINNDSVDDLFIGGNAMRIFFGHTGEWSNYTVEEANATIINTASTVKISNPVGVRDVNNDGFSDLFMASFWDYPQGTTKCYDNLINRSTLAEAYLFFGGNSSDWTVDTPVSKSNATFIAEAVGDYMGHGLDGVGDVNSDGYDDLIITSEFRGQGKVYLILGSPTNEWNKTTKISEAASASFLGSGDVVNLGINAVGVGDVNNDGFDDFMLSAVKLVDIPNSIIPLRKRIFYLIFGRSSNQWYKNLLIDDVANITFMISTETEQRGYAGRYVSGLDDVNDDGLDDFAFGADDDNEGGTHAGQVFVFFGRNTNQWPSTPTSINASDYANASFLGTPYENAGFSVSRAEDINGDGYNDILIGATGEREKAYIIFGQTNGWAMDQPLSSVNFALIGDYPEPLAGEKNYFGFDVSGIGDINDDNYADFRISSPLADNCKGIVFVIFGGEVFPPCIDCTSTSSYTTSTSTSTSTPALSLIILVMSLTTILVSRKIKYRFD